MKTHTVYCIIYLENKYYHTINEELKEYGYKRIRAIIPTVKILKHISSRRKPIYQEEPVLFNYGFLRMPSDKALDRDFLRKLQRRVRGIRGFLRNTETLHPRKKRARIDNLDIWDDFSLVATTPRNEVRRFIRIGHKNKRFSVGDMVSIKIGDYIILKGYPFDGVDATVLDISPNKKKVKLLLYPENGRMEIWLPFDNVVYSVYQNYDPHKLSVDSSDYDPNGITEEKINKNLSFRQV